MLKSLVGLCQAALLAGMTGLAPYVAGRCALGASPMPAMAMHGGSAMDGHGGAPACPHHHHGCCGCLGPCSGCTPAALPAAPAAALVAPSGASVPTLASARRPALAPRHLLPFANGPPAPLG